MSVLSPIQCTNYHPSKNHSDVERWICIYPAYINSRKTRQEGRRLSKEKCVENPTFCEIRDVLSVTNLRVGVENKQYCREKSTELHCRGRVRVEMRKDDGTFCNSDLASRESIMLYVASKIPQLKTRQNKPAESYQQPQATQMQPTGATAGAGGKKGKSKKRTN